MADQCSPQQGVAGLTACCDRMFRALSEYCLQTDAALTGTVSLTAREGGIDFALNGGEAQKLFDLLPAAYTGAVEEIKKELNSLVGLGPVKEYVFGLADNLEVQQRRAAAGRKTASLSMHMIFTGNPGTGKTMMARMMARIYRSLGILSKGQLVEVDRSGLVAGYVGQTALKTQKVIEKAMGGVLFVDEAYALNGRSENDFGQEAIDTLLKAMEDHRDDLVVIVAGYTDLMDKFIHSNPGLESRFNRFLLFEDYSLDELMAIFKMRCGKGYVLSPEAEPLVRDYIAEESAAGDSFGNARGVRNIFEHILVAQNNRLAKLDSVTRDDLMTLTADDVLHARGMVDEPEKS